MGNQLSTFLTGSTNTGRKVRDLSKVRPRPDASANGSDESGSDVDESEDESEDESPPTKRRRLEGSTTSGASSKKTKVSAEEKAFLKAYPEMKETQHIGDLRNTEFSRLDREKHVYLDYTGGGLYAESQLKEHLTMLATQTFGNPHSSNPTSQAMTALVDQTRTDILAFFNTNAEEYDCIFTSGCSGALRIVGEAYPFCKNGRYVLPQDNHNSVNGIREFARAKGASVTYLDIQDDLRLDMKKCLAELKKPSHCKSAPKLFAFPAQSNFSGVKHPLSLIKTAKDLGWDVVLDAAAFAPTSPIDLSVIKPDFMTLSFYKIFGYPTGLGALIVKRTALPRILSRPWFAGGTIEVALVVHTKKHWLHTNHEAFEDGTINYLAIPALAVGMRFIKKLGMNHIATRVRCMTQYLLDEFKALKHKNGQGLIRLHGPDDTADRGGTITFNCFDCQGKVISCSTVETLANQQKISVRSGCFCNPGCGETVQRQSGYWSHVEGRLKDCAAQHCCVTKATLLGGVDMTGAVRVSVGVPTNFNDLHAVVTLLRTTFLDRTRAEVEAMCAKKEIK